MEMKQAILNRRSIRGFLDRPVSKEIIEDILKTASRAVSANNTQPWEFAVITGDVMKQLADDNMKRFERGEPEDFPDIPFNDIYRVRQVDMAKQLFGAMNIERGDKERRHWWMGRGFRFFDAPAVIILMMDDSLDETAARFDMGCVAQNICLAAMEHGLGTCVEDQAIMYQSGLRKILHIPENKRFVSGIAIGYADPDFAANDVVSERADVSENTSWYGFE